MVIFGCLYVEFFILICLGFEWYIGGDDNCNVFVEVVYCRVGDLGWKIGMFFIWIGDEMVGIVELIYRMLSFFVGSIIDLEFDMEYECCFMFSDFDGVEFG